MYESHFGITGLPFQLNPDPSFYFDSRGHRSALAYLKFGVHQGEGFIVVTGEIGAGKTTLVRTLLGELDAEKIVAAQIVSTQLEAGDLLRAIVTAFGIPSKSLTKADLISTIEGFLTALTAKGRRALLIVDEAQNLNREAIEELRMLSNFMLGNRSLLQSFLVGQPELRSLLLSKPMEQFRQRVIASCHLGPLDTTETRAYIEHRLHKVGWKYDPGFAPNAFDEIYRWTGGVPRRVNILCNRIMLAAFLNGDHVIDAQVVERVARELRTEVGDPSGPVELPLALPPRIVPQQSPAAAQAARDEALAALRFAEPTASQPMPLDQLPAPAEPGTPGPLLCVIASRSDTVKLAPLVRHLAARKDLPGVRLVHTGHADEALFAELDLPVADVSLEVIAGSNTQRTAEVMLRFEPVIDATQPSAVLLVGGSDAALACSLVASKKDVPVVNLEAGLRSFERGEPAEINRRMTDQLAGLLCTTVRSAQYTLVREGIADKRVQFVGNLLADAVKQVATQAIKPQDTLRRLGSDAACMADRNGYGVVTLQHDSNISDRSVFAQVLGALQVASTELPLLWLMHERTRSRFEDMGLLSMILDARIKLLPAVGYREMIGMIAGATCVMTDCGEVQEEATVLGVPCMTLLPYTDRLITVDEGSNTVVGRSRSLLNRAIGETLKYGGKKGRPPELWDGETSRRIGDHLVEWLREQATARRSGGAVQAA